MKTFAIYGIMNYEDPSMIGTIANYISDWFGKKFNCEFTPHDDHDDEAFFKFTVDFESEEIYHYFGNIHSIVNRLIDDVGKCLYDNITVKIIGEDTIKKYDIVGDCDIEIDWQDFFYGD